MTRQAADKRVLALRNFAISITVFNIAGYAFLGFEQPWLWPLIALATAYTLELVLETVGTRGDGREPRYRGNGFRGLVEFLYPAHITALAVNMLVYVNDQVLVMMFAVMVAISGKWLFQAPVRGRMRHYMNPSNLGIAVVLLLFPWVSIAPPYHFTEYLSGIGDWIVPGIILVFGTLLNAKLTGRMWVVIGWVSIFVVQAVVRGVLFDTAIPAALVVMTGVAFVLFTNYMITDPGTTPSAPFSQFAFGGGAAALYGVFTGLHIAYGIFLALALTCLIRGLFLWSLEFSHRARQREQAVVGGTDPDAGAAGVTGGAGGAGTPAGPTVTEKEVLRA
jgi:enediyne biosynthesis protein E5